MPTIDFWLGVAIGVSGTIVLGMVTMYVVLVWYGIIVICGEDHDGA